MNRSPTVHEPNIVSPEPFNSEVSRVVKRSTEIRRSLRRLTALSLALGDSVLRSQPSDPSQVPEIKAVTDGRELNDED